MNKIAWLTIVLAISLLPACTTPGPDPCRVQAQTYIQDIETLLVKWDGLYALILETPREELGKPVDDLDQIYLQALNLTPPDCVQQAHSQLLEGMSLVVEGARIYMSPTSGSAAYFRIQAGQERIDAFRVELTKLKAGQPPYN
ncbi:MAG: hypothetical protein KKA73_15840 [Chloroflexi bacterium]|nr:hypothetical protein [Chloroflexota bacterium]MBU1749156.1 hypothetical protein [Chloroflexota bacterium]